MDMCEEWKKVELPKSGCTKKYKERGAGVDHVKDGKSK